MPQISPPRSSSRPVTCSFTSAFLKKAVMNLPEPSGSSPPEKPPGMKIICAPFTASAKLCALLAMPAALRLFMTIMRALAPASSTARAESYSQFVPGNTGMTTSGFAVRILHFTRFCALKLTFFAQPSLLTSLQAYTLSSLSSYAPVRRDKSIASPLYVKLPLSVALPIISAFSIAPSVSTRKAP